LYVTSLKSYHSRAGPGESESLAPKSEEKVTKSKKGLEAFNRWVLKKGYVHNLQKGDHVHACWLKKDLYEGNWFPGMIVDASKGYYQVKFSEGGQGAMLSDCHVMPFDVRFAVPCLFLTSHCTTALTVCNLMYTNFSFSSPVCSD